MASYYVRSTDGNNADSGATWALAKADLQTPTWAAGDVIYVSQNHAQSTAASITIDGNGTLASPTQIIGSNDAAEPPTAVSTTGTVTTTGTANITIRDSIYVYGLTFSAGTGAGDATINFNDTGNHWQHFEACAFRLVASGGSGLIRATAADITAGRYVFRSCTFKFANANHAFLLSNGDVSIEGGGIESGSTANTAGVFSAGFSNRPARAMISGFDFSNAGSAAPLVKQNSGCNKVVFRNCKLPASWTGTLVTGTLVAGSRYEMWNCDNADTNYRIWIEDYAGSIKQSSTVYKDSFSGGTKHSYIFASSANAEYPAIQLVGPEFFADNSTTGSSVTATVEVVTDNVTLKDDECWLEVMYLGTSGTPLGAWITDCKADVLATAANQTTSTETWTTTGLTTPVKQKLSVTFTPQEAGYVIGRVVLAKASTTVYVDPQLVMS